MTEQPHDTPAFQHAAEYTIAVTFVVAGGKRPRTADHRAHRVGEQIANYTAPWAKSVEVTAAGGASTHGTVTWPTPIPSLSIAVSAAGRSPRPASAAPPTATPS